MKGEKAMKLANMMTQTDIIGMRRLMRDKSLRKEVRINCFSKQNSSSPLARIEPMEELLQRDKQREEDGFSKKIKYRRVPAGAGKIITIPFVEEEQLIHGDFEPDLNPENNEEKEDIDETLGHGEGEEGSVIGNIPIRDEYGEGGEGEPQPGEGSGGEHEIEEKAYQKGIELSIEYKLPNLKEKGEKVPTNEFVYDLTDRHKGSGQVLDIKETQKKIVETNVILGKIDKDNIDTTNMIVSPTDMIYRVLSKERVWKSQAVVFFVRDYSYSMYGEPTRIIVEQHMIIYAWLMLQYESLVIPRFFVHDTEAKEVSPNQYFRLVAGGGTLIQSVYEEINKTVESEALNKNYNIFVFQGTDGDDWNDSSGRGAITELRKMLNYVNRMGICVLKHPYWNDARIKTVFEQYIENSGLLNREDILRVCAMSQDGNITEEKNADAVKKMIAQN